MNHGARPLRSTRRPQNLAGRPGWYKITNSAADTPTQIAIYDEIGFYGVAAADFLADLKGISGDIQLNINSPGGDVWDGISIYNQLKQRQGDVHVIVDGLAASAASFIAQAASPGRLEMAPHSQMMIHDGFGMVIGNAADMRETADLLDKTSDEIAGIYADRTGKPSSHWRDLMRNETWFSDSEAVAAGLADKVHGKDDAPQDSWDLSVFAKFSNTAPVVVNADGNHGPMTGSHSHAHPAYGGQGGDATHSHDHSHDGDANHGHSHAAPPPVDKAASADAPDDAPDGKDCPTCKGTGKIMDGHVKCPDCKGTGKVPADAPDDGTDNKLTPAGNELVPSVVNDGSIDNSPWDASKAWSAGADSDDPAAFYKSICAGRKTGDPSTQAAWALPYKYTPSSAPNAAGVRNALARLSSTQGLTNAADAKSLLEGLMKKISPDYDPDDLSDFGLVASAFRQGLNPVAA